MRLGNDYKVAFTEDLPMLRDLDQPFPFNIRMRKGHYRFNFYDTASPEHYTLLRPAMVVLCYSIADPSTLQSLYTTWKKVVERHFNYDEKLPVVVLGLKLDVRRPEDYRGHVKPLTSAGGNGDGRSRNGRTIVYFEEGLKVAQEMRCDMYCECSALSGQVCVLNMRDGAPTALEDARLVFQIVSDTQPTMCSPYPAYR